MFPEQGMVSAVLRRSSNPRPWQTLTSIVNADAPSRSFAFEQVLAGEFELEVTLTEIARSGGARTVIFDSTQPVVIRQNETTEVRPR